MAINTKAKRASVVQFMAAPMRTLPPPKASVDLGARAHLAREYSGIAYAPPTPPVTTGGEYIITFRRHGRR